MGSVVVQEKVQCTMKVGASTLRVVMRVILTFGCTMGDATLRDVGRTLQSFGRFMWKCSRMKRWACGWGKQWVCQSVALGVRKTAGVECLWLRMQQYGGVEEWQWQWCMAPPTN
jgi:hypothetical protein